MENFRFYSPTEFVFGKDAEREVGHLLVKHHATRALVHYGGGSVVRSGLLQRVEDAMRAAGVAYVPFGGAVPNPRSGLVYQGIELARREHVDFVLAVGGGSAIDSAKAIALGVRYPGDFWDLYDGKAPIVDGLPVGVVLTIPAAGSEASASAVITHEKGMLKRGVLSDFNRPKFAVVNPELTYTLPPYQTAAGVTDMMAHIFERYLTRSTGVELTDQLCEATLRSIVDAARIVMMEPANYDARATICWAGTIAHNGSLGVGRVEDWSTHGLEHELSALYDVTHGAGLAVMFPAYMKYTVDVDVERYRRLAVNVWGVADDPKNPRAVALAGIAAFEAFLSEIGMPTRFEGIGARKEDIETLLDKLEVNRGKVLGQFMRLTRDDARRIYLLACE
ncbi:MAG: iron-containing alcohol dehydrogenase [Candidatus Izemoplasmatales bacterium]